MSANLLAPRGGKFWSPPETVHSDGALFRFYAFEGEVRKDAWGRILNPLEWEAYAEGHAWAEIVERWEAHNMIVTVGKDKMMRQLFGLTTLPLNTTGVGTDSTAASVGQTKLNPTVAGSVSLIALDATFPTYASPTATTQTTYGTGSANFSWNEVGLFDGTTNGTSIMFDRTVFGPFTKSSSVSIIVVGSITQS